jgi:hypothetical protein
MASATAAAVAGYSGRTIKVGWASTGGHLPDRLIPVSVAFRRPSGMNLVLLRPKYSRFRRILLSRWGLFHGTHLVLSRDRVRHPMPLRKIRAPRIILSGCSRISISSQLMWAHTRHHLVSACGYVCHSLPHFSCVGNTAPPDRQTPRFCVSMRLGIHIKPAEWIEFDHIVLCHRV